MTPNPADTQHPNPADTQHPLHLVVQGEEVDTGAVTTDMESVLPTYRHASSSCR